MTHRYYLQAGFNFIRRFFSKFIYIFFLMFHFHFLMFPDFTLRLFTFFCWHFFYQSVLDMEGLQKLLPGYGGSSEASPWIWRVFRSFSLDMEGLQKLLPGYGGSSEASPWIWKASHWIRRIFRSLSNLPRIIQSSSITFSFHHSH
jgi:hypothetical protein